MHRSGTKASGMETLDPIQVLVEELQDEDLQMRLNSIKRLSTIALALGDAKTRDQLIPYLTSNFDEEDEIRLAVAEELAQFVPLVGGPAHAPCLIAPLVNLAKIDEIVVREKAVETLNSIIEVLAPADVEKHAVPAVTALGGAEFFAPRASACGILPSVYARVSAPQQAELRQMYATLCRDDTPMVRRPAASALGKVAAASSAAVIKSELLPLFALLLDHDHDSVRLLAVGSASSFMKVLGDEGVPVVMPSVHSASKDRSWKVRSASAELFNALQDVVSPDTLKAELMPVLSRLLQDQEAEVRTKAIFQVPNVGRTLAQIDKETIIVTNVVPHLKKLADDANQHVRSALSTVLVSLTPELGKAKTVEYIVPLLLLLLKDEFADVRLNVISKLGDLQEVIGADQLCKVILPPVIALAEDPQWRVRLAIVEQLPAFAKSLGTGPFDARLLSPSMTWLMDSVYAVRSAMVSQLPQVVTVFGEAWAAKSLFPKLVAMASSSVADRGYLSRLTLLLSIRTVVASVSPDLLKKDLLPITLKLSKDNVPNVRFNAARALGLIAAKVDASTCKSQIQPALSTMSSDDDSDVQFYAKEALTKCQ
eukprot:m.353227 g.353227  ORF g.353227 m.353227 type:complete len:595 (-) comp16714_c0_seq1:243-2027(-)